MTAGERNPLRRIRRRVMLGSRDYEGLVATVLRRELAPMAADVQTIRDLVATMNHELHESHQVLMNLNHDVRVGAEDVLPLYVGYAERFRTDADTMIAVAEIVDRQLTLVEQAVERLATAAEQVPDAARQVP